MRHEPIDEPHSSCTPDWKDGGLETEPLGLVLPLREPATERAADPSWKVL